MQVFVYVWLWVSVCRSFYVDMDAQCRSIDAYVFSCIDVCMSLCVHVAFVCVDVCMCMCVCVMFAYMDLCMSLCVRVAFVCVDRQTFVRAYIYTYVHTYI